MDLLQQALNGRFASVMLYWVMGGGSVQELEPATCHGYAASLCASATEAWRPQIRQRMLDFQAALIAVRRQSPLV
jgi:hypothetical protein